MLQGAVKDRSTGAALISPGFSAATKPGARGRRPKERQGGRVRFGREAVHASPKVASNKKNPAPPASRDASFRPVTLGWALPELEPAFRSGSGSDRASGHRHRGREAAKRAGMRAPNAARMAAGRDDNVLFVALPPAPLQRGSNATNDTCIGPSTRPSFQNGEQGCEPLCPGRGRPGVQFSRLRRRSDREKCRLG